MSKNAVKIELKGHWVPKCSSYFYFLDYIFSVGLCQVKNISFSYALFHSPKEKVTEKAIEEFPGSTMLGNVSLLTNVGIIEVPTNALSCLDQRFAICFWKHFLHSFMDVSKYQQQQSCILPFRHPSIHFNPHFFSTVKLIHLQVKYISSFYCFCFF